MTIYCRGVKGATTVESDDEENILQATRELLAVMIRRNSMQAEDVASAIFTTTPDLVSAFPAKAARQLGWLDMPLISVHEIGVPKALGMCIRVVVHWNTEKSQADIQHIYLRKAEALRRDKTVVLSAEDTDELNQWLKVNLRTLDAG